MPHCLGHAMLAVQAYLLRAGIASAGDLAGWWRTTDEIHSQGAGLGWSEAEVDSAVAAWSVSRHVNLRGLPNLPLPRELSDLQPAAAEPSLVPSSIVSLESLRKVEVDPKPDTTLLKKKLQAFYLKLGPAGTQ